MLKVPTFLGPSPISGIGLFAGCAISKGEVIWQFDARIDRLFTALTVEHLSAPAREFIYRYGCQCREDLWLLCGDDARFVNHAVPGVMACDLGDHLDAEDIALRSIDTGEEITEDYSRFALDFKRRGFYQVKARQGCGDEFRAEMRAHNALKEREVRALERIANKDTHNVLTAIADWWRDVNSRSMRVER